MPIEIFLRDQPPLSIPDTAYTYKGFHDWMSSAEIPDRGRFAFLENRLIIDTCPQHCQFHVAVKQELAFGIDMLVRERDLGDFLGSGILWSNDDLCVSNEPDGTVVLWETFESNRANIVVRPGSETEFSELVGSPDLIFEVVSDITEDKDTRVLRDAYFDAGIREYWLVDARGDEIDFQILVRGDTGFVAVEPVEGMTASEVLPASFRLTRERDRIGMWKYSLEVIERT